MLRSTISIIFLAYANFLQAEVSISHAVPAAEVLESSELIAKGKVVDVLWQGGVEDGQCFSYIYEFLIEDVYKGEATSGEVIKVGMNFYSIPVFEGQKQVVILQSLMKNFFDYCDTSSIPRDIDLSSTKIFFSSPITAYELYGKSHNEFRAIKCHSEKRFLFDEDNSDKSVTVSESELHGRRCTTVVGEYDRLISNILSSLPPPGGELRDTH